MSWNEWTDVEKILDRHVGFSDLKEGEGSLGSYMVEFREETSICKYVVVKKYMSGQQWISG